MFLVDFRFTKMMKIPPSSVVETMYPTPVMNLSCLTKTTPLQEDLESRRNTRKFWKLSKVLNTITMVTIIVIVTALWSC